MRNIKMQDINVNQGEKVSTYIKVIDSDLLLPITLICGNKEGKTVLITAGIHNSEYVGIQAAIELGNEINPKDICGNIIILPLVNMSGYEHRTMSLTYEDNKNLNREFPGNKDGSLSEKITYFIEKELFSISDYYIDLHSGDGYEDLIPYVYCQGNACEETKRWSMKMAEAVNVDFIVQSQSNKGGAYNYAGSIGLPGILIERGCMGKWSKEEVQEDKNDVMRILSILSMLDNKNLSLNNKGYFITNVIYENSKYTGCWYPNYKAGHFFKKGDELGTVKDYFGNALETCIAQVNGIVLYQTGSLSILKGGPMIAYGEI